jgi:hypothetical protein
MPAGYLVEAENVG